MLRDTRSALINKRTDEMPNIGFKLCVSKFFLDRADLM